VIPLTRLEIGETDAALPPWQLVPRIAALDPALRPHALDACGPEGWGTPPGGRGPGSSLLAVEPELELRGGSEVFGELDRWARPDPGSDPLGAIALGYLSYDLGREFERIPSLIPIGVPPPPVYLACFRAVYLWREGRGCVVGSDARAVERLADRVRAASALAEPVADPEAADLARPRVAPPARDFLEGVAAVRGWIRRGDVYQVNVSRRIEFARPEREQLARLYARLTRTSGAPFSAYLDAGDVQLLSNSPERFLRVAGRQVETCPIKGTRPRGRTPEEDGWLAKQLLHAPKDRAEHVMIVDLERNDLGRICRTGSVRVDRLAELRSFANVHHLVSSVRGELRDRTDRHDWLAATFPGGSITGAPKLRAMEIIEALEPVRRGIYTGAIGCFDASGGLDLSIAIRTAVAEGEHLLLQLGGGIVAESDPEAELQETREKGRAFERLWSAA
jgi:para-aminobenzoate synthetase component 1